MINIMHDVGSHASPLPVVYEFRDVCGTMSFL